ncbi:MMPL family transporter [Streptomyces sp. WAC02707]|uniref:MMPL family transporter n=1 Tax=unclassified Streptomyces TaxID=2593676 RepID=UPI000F79BDCD|nr:MULTISPECIES: MMPL family transporter [unclassified Streptomyces]NUV95672.1 MMPL family transporter [Streptomyces sp. KAI 90]RSS97937.1 MMPL family transporter [Streptomyces sp. WAC02707]
MATFLSRLGRLSFRRRWPIALLWVVLLVGTGVLAGKAPAAPPNDFSMPGTEAQQAYDLLEERFPELNADGATARVVFRAEYGKITDPGAKKAVQETVRDLGNDPQVTRVTDPYATRSVSEDGSTAYAQVSYQVPASDLEESSRTALQDAVEQAGSHELSVEVGGNAVNAVAGGHSSEALGLAVAAVVLVLTFGSLLAAGLPLLTAVLGVGIGGLAIKVLAEPLGLGSTTSGLATMLGLAVGIDYALFVVSRYRAELARGRSREEAAGHAVGTAGSAVVFAGLTVVIALAGLGVVGIPLLTQMGLAAAGTVVIAVLIAVTLIPALLGICGRRIGPPRAKRPRGEDDRPKQAMGVRWARFVVRRPVAVLLGGIALLGVIAVPAASLEMGLPGDESKPASTTQRRAYDLVAEGFGPGYNGPLTVVVQADRGGSAKTAAQDVAEEIRDRKDVAAVGQPRLSEDGDTAVLNVVPTTAPSSAETADLVHALRAPGLASANDVHVLVAGSTAMNVDVSQKLSDALLPYLGLVVGLAFLLLIAVFRSLLVPLKAALGFLLSVVAGLGAVVAVFQWGWLASLFGVAEPGPVMSMMPIFMVGVVFGLAMDYEVFLVTRMREAYVHGQSPSDAVISGFEHSGRVVTAAAVIMISVFGSFMGSDEQMLKTIGFGLAAAVLFDAFLVRMALVPAVLSLLGRLAWRLPGWLDRLVPDLDVEGERLERDAVDPTRPGSQASPDGEPDRVTETTGSGSGH